MSQNSTDIEVTKLTRKAVPDVSSPQALVTLGVLRVPRPAVDAQHVARVGPKTALKPPQLLLSPAKAPWPTVSHHMTDFMTLVG
jgi:hypothetical protein